MVASVHPNADRPSRIRSASIRNRSSTRCTARSGVTPGTSGSSVKAAPNASTRVLVANVTNDVPDPACGASDVTAPDAVTTPLRVASPPDTSAAT